MAFTENIDDRKKKVDRKATNKSGLLTDVGVKNLKPEGKQYYERETTGDPETRGFSVRVAPSGTRTFYLSYSLDGKRKHYKLGAYGDEYPLSKARADCKRARGLIAEGKDPSVERDRKRNDLQKERERIEAENRAVTVNEALDYYISTLSESTAKSVSALFTNKFCDVRAEVGGKKLRDVTEEDIEDLLEVHLSRGRRRNAGKLFSYLASAFKRSKRYRPFKLRDWMNPFLNLERPEDSLGKPGERALDAGEIKVFWEMLGRDSEMNVAVKAVLQLVLLSGQRVEQTSKMRWSHLDIEARVWDVPPVDTKTGKKNSVGHVVPLTNWMVSVIENCPASDGEDLLFPGGRVGQPFDVATFSKQLGKMLLCDGGLERFVPRDLRRTVKTHMSRIGVLKEVRDRIQGHAMNDVASKHYDRYDYLKEKREGLEKWERELKNIIGEEHGDNVVRHHG
jgi:integrase